MTGEKRFEIMQARRALHRSPVSRWSEHFWSDEALRSAPVCTKRM